MLKVIMMSEVTINLNMFGHFMKDRVVCNINNTLIATIHKSGIKRETPISASKQHNQTISLVVDAISRYSTFVKNQETIVNLFLTFLRNKRIQKKKIQNLVGDL